MSRSLEERVSTTTRRLVLIHAALNLQDDVAIDNDDLFAAVAELALHAYEDLEPLTHAPAEVANWAPDEQSHDEQSHEERDGR